MSKIPPALPSEFDDPLAYDIYLELREEYGLNEPKEPQPLDMSFAATDSPLNQTIYPLPNNPQTLIADALIANASCKYL